MADDRAKQYLIAERALRHLFEGDIILDHETGVFRILGTLRLGGLQTSLAYLTENTGRGREIDPFEKADETAWVILSQLLSRVGFRLAALDVASRYVELCYKLQVESNSRIHKGAPLFWLSERLLENGQESLAAGSMMLAFVEDIWHYRSPSEAPAYQRLVGMFGVSHSALDNLIEYARKTFREAAFFPEVVLTAWEMEKLPRLHVPRARSRAEF